MSEPILVEGLSEIYTAKGSRPDSQGETVTSIRDGAILIRDGRIAAIGPAGSFEVPVEATRVDMGGRVAIPCFIDPHTHLVWGGDRGEEFNRRLHGATYVEIAQAGGGIKSTVRQTRAADKGTLEARARRTLDTMLLHGVATIEAKTGYGLDLETELRQLDVMDALADHPVALHQTFMGAHEVPEEYEGRPRSYIDFLNAELLPRVAERGTVPFVDIFCEKGVFEIEDSRRHLQRAAELGFALRLHADELFPLGGAGLAAELGAVGADHLVHTSPEHRRAMARAGVMATLLPGTSFFLRGPYADAKGFLEDGCDIALSTDFNPGSSHTVSQALMMALACMNMGLTLEQSFCGVTLNAACAIGQGDRLGTIEVGKDADISFLDVPSASYLVYYWGINHVTDVIKGGRRVVRDRRLSA